MDQKKKGGSRTKKKETVPIWRLFQFASKVDLLLVVVAAICSCAAGAIQPISILFFGDVLKNLNEAVISNENVVEKARPIILIYVCLGTGTMVTAYLSNCLWILTGENQARRVRQLYVHSILGQDMSWFDQSEKESLSTRLASDIQLVQDGISERFGQFLLCLAQLIAGCIVAFIKGWRLSILMLAVIPVILCTCGVMGVLVTKYTVITQDAYADAGSISEQVFSSIRTIYSFSLQQRFTKSYEDKLQHSMRASVKRGVVLGFGLGTVLFSMFSVSSLTFWYGTGLVQNHLMDSSTVIVVFMVMIQGELSLLQLPNNFATVLSASAAAYKVFETINRVPEIDSNDQGGLKPQKIQGKLEFKHVKFRYPTRPDITILKDFSLQINPGMTVAFVGPSGSGKSTSIQLLQRFYDPLSGEIVLDGKNLKKFNVKWLRQQIGIVSQEPVLFNTSIRENIMMGSTDKNISFQDIIMVCKKANCHSFIKQLPKGYDTLVGEHGAMMSGGQKQRIAIARAILKNPAILLLDEATSALDIQSEKLVRIAALNMCLLRALVNNTNISQVQKALDEASASRTTLIIAHRLSTVRNADLIVVMEDGNLIEQGTHNDLLAMNGVYKELVLKQQIQTSIDNNIHLAQEEEDKYNETLLRNEAIEINRKSCIELQRASEPLAIGSTPSTARKSRISMSDRQEKHLGLEKQKAPIWRIIKQMRHHWPLMALGTVGSALAGSVFPLHSLLFAKVIASLIENNDKQEHLNLYSSLFIILGVMAFLGFSIQVVCFETAGSRYTKKLRSLLFAAFMRQEIGYFDQDQNSLGSLTSRLAVDARNVNEMITRVWPDIIQILFTSSTGLTIAFMHSWMLTLIVCCMSPLVIGAVGWNSKVQEGYEGNTKEANEQSAEVANEAIKEIRTVTALNKQTFFEDKYFIATSKPHQLTQRKAYISSIGFALLQSISFYSNAVGFYAGATLIMQNKLQLDQMMITMMAIMSMAEGIGRSSICIPIFSKAKIAAIATFEIMDRQPTIDSELEGIEPGNEDIDGVIDFNNISFRYPARPDISIFDGEFNLKGKSGQTIALVGPSGSGKSTVIGMLQRWYDPSKGTVRLDNHNVKSFSLKNLRGHMALVGQEPVLFDLSIEDNVRLGVDDTKYVNREQVEEACKAANIHKFISSLPDGYNTRAGSKGSQLSGGQKQRIAIARALIRKPKLLLLDEATSALDSESEKLVQEALDSILRENDLTTITIAHRLSTITNADLICVIKDGRVIEQGNHWNLLELNGVYKDLVQQQSLNTT